MRNRSRARITVLAAGLFLAALATPFRAGWAKDPGVVFGKMLDTYANCRTLRVRGVLHRDATQSIPNARSYHSVDNNQFRLDFVRPSLYRFEFLENKGIYPISLLFGDPRNRHVIWSEGGEGVHSWEGKPGERGIRKEEVSILQAAYHARWEAAGSSTLLTSLLYSDNSDVGQVSVARLRDLKSVGMETVDGKPCYKLTGNIQKNKMHIEALLWIDSQTYLMARLLVKYIFLDTDSSYITTYRFDNDLNQSIPESVFSLSGE